tara:strand:+ start:66270 stop:66584 length:315 start_codon:yes stop_codon:yes gene_type:complete
VAGGFLRTDGDDLLIAVRLTPKSAKETIGGMWQDEKGMHWLQASVRAVPEKGRANAALIQLIAKRLKLPAKGIVLESGDTGRLKRLRLVGHAEEAARITEELDG